MNVSEGKMYYSISEVCRETGLEQHVLRYWETEFPSLKPKKNRAGNRAYRKKEIDLIKFIKQLLYEKQYTIQGAKKVLVKQKDSIKSESLDDNDKPVVKKRLTEIKKELLEIKKEIDSILKNSS
jgi:DNA-binding transcriptional MerR regulator